MIIPLHILRARDERYAKLVLKIEVLFLLVPDDHYNVVDSGFFQLPDLTLD